MKTNLRVLTVFSDPQLSDRLQTLLSRRSIESNRIPSGAGALILTGNLNYDLIVLQHPLPDLATEDFLAALRTLDSTSTNSPVLVVAREDQIEDVTRAYEGVLVKAISTEADEAAFHSTVSSLLGVSPRYTARVMVHIEVGLENGVTTRMYQAENLSESGMLLRGGRELPVGTPVRFQFSLPNDVNPVAGVGRVVRHTDPKEETRGIALQFAELGADAIRRLRQYAASKAANSAVVAGASHPSGPQAAQRS